MLRKLLHYARNLLGRPARCDLLIENNSICISFPSAQLAQRAAQSIRTAQTITLQVGSGAIRLITCGARQDVAITFQTRMAFQLHLHPDRQGLHCIIAAGNRPLVRRPIHTMQIFTNRLPPETPHFVEEISK